jgi:hypothetical protein
MELVMPDRITNDTKMDAPTSRAVAHGIGEKLRQTLGTDSRFPDQLQKLLEEIRDREARDVSAKGSGR